MILIYDPFPDFNRAPILYDLAATLSRGNHQCVLLLEQTSPETGLNYTASINAYAPVNGTFPIYIAPRSATQLERREFLRELAPEVLIIWNGSTKDHKLLLADLSECCLAPRCIWMEHGWLPQHSTCVFDSHGIGGDHSLASEMPKRLNSEEADQLKTWKNAFLPAKLLSISEQPNSILVPLQVNSDVNIQKYSPFKSMGEFVDYLTTWIPNHWMVSLRPHPKADSDPARHTLPDNFRWVLNREPFLTAAARNTCVLGINSTCLIEAMLLAKPILAFGGGIFDSSRAMTKVQPGDSFPEELNVDMDSRCELLHRLIFKEQCQLHAIHDQNYQALIKNNTLQNALKSDSNNPVKDTIPADKYGFHQPDVLGPLSFMKNIAFRAKIATASKIGLH